MHRAIVGVKPDQGGDGVAIRPSPARRGARDDRAGTVVGVTGVIPSSLHSSETDVSRCAMAAWIVRTWAFVREKVRPPLRPRARAA